MRAGAAFLWLVPAVVVMASFVAAAFSPLLAWRDPIYIAASFAGIAAMALLAYQPLLAGGYLPGLRIIAARRIHRIFGAVLVLAVMAHVGGLWITSPPDVIDALLFASPTPFSLWGVIAMWAVFATGLLAVFRIWHRLPRRLWRWCHLAFAVVIAAGTILHVVLIEGTLHPVSKYLLCFLVGLATLFLLRDLRRQTATRTQR